ncbi:hypothetical protein NPIL_526031 [Nephila pilipes]|uniref:Uncharacterized protein n=1 Tax=Nephila pilipes TaxID=299642 RepID=A0A8X6PVX7_NEPPI|nr:hypothetical protein NPIL_526031 [Nephila pilipes]
MDHQTESDNENGTRGEEQANKSFLSTDTSNIYSPLYATIFRCPKPKPWAEPRLWRTQSPSFVKHGIRGYDATFTIAKMRFTVSFGELPDHSLPSRPGEVSPKPIKPTSEVSGLAESGPKPCESRSRTSGWTNPPPPPPIKLRRCHDNHSN